MQNSLWNEDAFPNLPLLEPGKPVTIGRFEGPGQITRVHLTLSPGIEDREYLQQTVFLRVTYNDQSSPSIFISYGDFFGEQFGEMQTFYDSELFAYHPRYSAFSYNVMPYEKSITVELINNGNMTLGGYACVTNEDVAVWQPRHMAYFHATHSSTSSNFPFDTVKVAAVDGHGHIVGLRYSVQTTRTDVITIAKGVNGICEGNFNFFVDNSTAITGNSSDASLIAFLGSEDLFGFSWGWGTQYTGLESGVTVLSETEATGSSPGQLRLSSFRLFTHGPIRFRRTLRAEVDWQWDHARVPSECLQHGCEVLFGATVYFYLSTPL